MIDHQLTVTGTDKAFDVVKDQRFTRHCKQWFRSMISEGAHAFTPSCGQNHGFHGDVDGIVPLLVVK
jgi:hypothetical protein